MNNKTLFTEAHKIANATVAEVGDYRIAFKLALVEIKQNEIVKQSQSVTIAQRFNAVCSVASDLALILFVVTLMIAFCGLGVALLTTGIKHDVFAMVLGGGVFSLVCVWLTGIMIKTEITMIPCNYDNALKGY
tara:strand:- start:1250 stop:1648 length:399 start_codon:yes stop_codon:yes gene_type:complete